MTPAQQHDVDLTKALAITTKTGELRMFKTSVSLTVENGGLVKPPGMGNIALVTAEGFKAMGMRAGLQILNAHTVIVDGIEQKNPHVERNPKTRQPVAVTCRSFCAGYTSLGVPVVTDRTVVFDLVTYEALDLLQKCKNKPGVFVMKGADSKPQSGWRAFPIDDIVSVHVNLAETEAIQHVVNATNRKKKAVEIAQTFSQRNALKAHPSITVTSIKDGNSILVPMTCWRPTKGDMTRWDMSEFHARVQEIEAISQGAETTGDEGQGVHVDTATDQLHEDEAAGIIDVETAEPEDPTQEEDQAGNAPADAFQRIKLEVKSALVSTDKELKAKAHAAVTGVTGDLSELFNIDQAADDVTIAIHQAITGA